ncbi:5'-methylthioadenosine/S-adenosylhomocysteine nucleosidase [Mycoplasma tullyi]|uniref:5'-methylthioadenosine/S-adenosylhomocysteine nucleosidase n=1 Tax=Mycoplasma tullyi TaxID=1612150 RepID=A0A7D7YJ03_9MOLU|nr:5'-methylthioadenosine/S-adenosylhomocysteine nucleosidase [Mycoplasma tullyi]QMT98261.1 5'-methylthioadenosine/S-adenosylhomocysteine nucleosidase [Mycoplasma tullyi]
MKLGNIFNLVKNKSNRKSKRYVIVVAMTDEVEAIIKKYQYHKDRDSIFIYSSDLLSDVDLAISGIGKANAASCTQHLIDQNCYKEIINIGIAGSLNPELKPAELVEVNQLIYGDVDVTYFNYQFGQIPKLPVSYSLKSGQYTCVSTDSFISKFNYQEIIKKIDLPIDLFEMEACAIAQVCHINNFKNLKVYKVVSDYVQLNELHDKLPDEFSEHVLDKVDYRFKVVDSKTNQEHLVNRDELVNHAYHKIFKWFEEKFDRKG